ncbi:hypothetical protein Pyn_14728 [Prunus yedoensis var. nudiflora]|uniref:Uncharacterized protein n=1 Tax=Prunus yedoensis var. nudiflora TaxID=2094558 RepID=A0A314UK96_PRUYE|nr:hypothetical protein Pyn_14728 [Prunus yedoensis var. nudiflora]
MMINTKTTNRLPCLQHQRLVLARGLANQISWHLTVINGGLPCLRDQRITQRGGTSILMRSQIFRV